MKKILTQYGALALAVALMVPLAQAQPVGMQTAFGKDAGTLSGVRKRHDQAGRADADSREPTRASGAVDRVRAQQRRGSALV